MFILSDKSPREYIEKRIELLNRDLFTARNVAYHFLDVIGERPDALDECYEPLPSSVIEELRTIASFSDTKYYSGQFSLCTDPVGTVVTSVDVQPGDPPTITVHIQSGTDEPEPFIVEPAHPFRIAIELLRQRLA